MALITRKQVIERVETLLGKENILFTSGHYYLSFDKFTKNVNILEKFKLHEFLNVNRDNIPTRVNLKLLVDVHNIQDVYGGKFKIGDTFALPHQKLKFKEEPMYDRYYREGNALCIIPLSKEYIHIRELYRACRLAKKTGGAILYKDHIHIDAMLTRRLEKWKEGRIKPPTPPEWLQFDNDEENDNSWLG